MRKKIVGMLTTATLLTMALAGNVQAAEIRSVGPDGEAAVDASTIELTDDQIAQIKEGGYTAAICLHYGGNDWSTSQQKGLEDTFGELGIEIVAVTDANFSAETQVSNIETVMAKKPDILVSIPTDATATADAYKQAAAAGIKIVFMDQRANGLEAGNRWKSDGCSVFRNKSTENQDVCLYVIRSTFCFCRCSVCRTYAVRKIFLW